MVFVLFGPLAAKRSATRDPIGYAGGANLDGYCGGGPVGWADPSGPRGSALQKGAPAAVRTGAGLAARRGIASSLVAVPVVGKVVLVGLAAVEIADILSDEFPITTTSAQIDAEVEAIRGSVSLAEPCSSASMSWNPGQDIGESPRIGTPIWRVAGGEAPINGRSWTPAYPPSVSNFRF